MKLTIPQFSQHMTYIIFLSETLSFIHKNYFTLRFQNIIIMNINFYRNIPLRPAWFNAEW